ncbi:putative extracellular nuclease/glycosyltransferase involved in cell wall biosynthesis [Gluconobacter cerinus]|uniref:Hint domain-containing protein n=1 Tax=Gluconobacter cerinus TaxID=38307 RepID=UPI0022275EEF|nr:Hint domain-containing protein [Gluconobacter cerinus]MCW2265037.1 putative extracellular nuclease/glycosyltransferase involved in cell wall biosynthesis [Gluconobacter cerinus]
MTSNLLINEFMFNPSASGDPNEFIEVKGDADTDYSEWSLIVVDGDGSVAGKIDNVFQLGTTNSAGYWVTPYQTNALQNGTQTVLLVKNFTGKAGDDLDTANGGTFTSTPWSEIGDTIAVSDGGSGDPTYAGAPVLTGKLIAGASRIPDGTDTNSASDWAIDDPSLAGIEGYGTTAAAGTVLVTPGAANDGSATGGSGTGTNTGGSDTGTGGSSGSDTGSGTGTGTGSETGGSSSGGTSTTPQTLTIQQINGVGYYSPYAGASVTTTGVVTAIDTNGSIGFWVQQASKDKDSIGSTGIFVYAGKTATLPTVGETVTITGTVTNYSGTSWSKSLTLPEINLVSYTDTGAAYAEIAPTVIGQGGLTVPAASYLGDLEQAIDLNKSTASLSPDTNALDFYRNLIGQVITLHDVVATGATASNATWVVPDNGNGLLTPTGALQSTESSINTQRVEIYYDSGVTPGSAISAEVGDKLGDITGVLTYYNGVYELIPTTQVTVIHTETPAPVTTFHKDEQNLLVSDYNIENFNALDPANADRLAQVAKIIVQNLDNPDVLAIQEIQDDSGTTSDGTVSAEQNLAALVKAIADAGGPTYSWAQVDPANNTQGGVTGGNIRSVFLYNADRVTLKEPVTTIGSEELSGTFKNTRLPLVGTFEFNGKDVTLINVHLSSQAGSSELYGATQPPVNHGGTTATVNNRIAQAQYITNYVQNQLSSNPTAKIGILGDFNDVAWSDANQVYANAGLTDMETKEDASNRYTYIYEGNAQSLDHTIGTDGFANAGQFQTLHINTGQLDGESDHDPSLTLLEMTDYSATSGAALSDVALTNSQTAAVHSGSTASNISVGDGSRLALYAGSTTKNIHLASGAKVDLPELAWSSSTTATLTDPSTLEISNGTDTYTIALDSDYAADFFTVQSDSTGGTLLLAEGTPCYCRGTLILTNRGEIPVEQLEIGDLVQTRSNGLRAIHWIGRRSYSGTFANGNRDILPVIFRSGSLGNNLPQQDLSVSPLHAMYLDGVLIPAVALVNGKSILQAERMDEVAYFHIELESHDVIFANGAESETFVDDSSRGMFHNASEYDALYPAAAQAQARYCAPRVEEGAQLATIRTRLNALSTKTRVATGALEGFLDVVTHTHIEGWARVPGSTDAVRLQILDNGVVLGEVTTSMARPDVGGACGFRFDIPSGLSPLDRHVLEVRRATDHAPLGNTPWMMDQMEQKIPQAVLAPSPVAPLDGFIDIATRNRISGWATNPANPEDVVTLQIVDNGVVLASIVANGRRPDVAKSGRPLLCGFDVILPGGLSPLTRHVLEVRREEDGALLGTPQVLEPVTAFDADMEQTVARAVSAAADEQSGDQVLSFLLGQVEKLRQSRALAVSGLAEQSLHATRRRRGMPTKATTQRKRALVIDSLRPDAKRDAGSQAILSHMMALETLGYDVCFVAADQMDMTAPLDSLPSVKVQGLPFFASVEDVLRRQLNSFDVVYLHREDIATRYMALVRRNQQKAYVLYSVADLHFLRLARQAAVQGRPELMAKANQIRVAEYRAALQADAVLTHSEAEAAQLRKDLPQAIVHVVPWATPAASTSSTSHDRNGVLFIGNYAHAPNSDAVQWLVNDIMPAVWAMDPTITCTLVGAEMPDSIHALASDRIRVLGHVQNLDSVLNQARLNVAPLRFGAGIKGKVLESLSAGVPCIMTPVAAEGLALPDSLRGLVQSTTQDMAQQIVALHSAKTLSGIIEAGQTYTSATFSEDAVTTALGMALERKVTLQAAG